MKIRLLSRKGDVDYPNFKEFQSDCRHNTGEAEGYGGSCKLMNVKRIKKVQCGTLTCPRIVIRPLKGETKDKPAIAVEASEVDSG